MRVEPSPKHATLQAYLVKDAANAKVYVTEQKAHGSLTIATEYEVLQDIALGLTDRVIAQRRNLSLRSVQNRLQQLYEKLGVRQPGDDNDSAPAFNLRSRAVNVALLRKLLNRTALEQAEIELQEWLKDPRFNYPRH